MPTVGQRASRTRRVRLEDKPITRLRTTIANQEGTVALDGTALVWTEPI